MRGIRSGTDIRAAVLMYHATPQGGAECCGADRWYSVAKSTFETQVRHLRNIGFELSSLRDVDRNQTGRNGAQVLLTFDDGHITNYTDAFPVLLAAGGKADFFVNSETVGSAHHVTWQNLKEMSCAGMSIQSHGHTHRYLSDLSIKEIEKELLVSKEIIEERLGKEVQYIAPPGGRYDARVVTAAKRIGYKGIATSEPGYAGFSGGSFIIPRIAVTRISRLSDIECFAKQKRLTIASLRCKYLIKGVPKILLGNKFYEKLRTALLESNA